MLTQAGLIVTANGLKVDGSGVAQPVVFGGANNATVTSIPASTSTIVLLAANAARKGALFFNNSSSPLYMGFGIEATGAIFTVKLQGQGFYEFCGTTYTGLITGSWDAASGNVQVTELS